MDAIMRADGKAPNLEKLEEMLEMTGKLNKIHTRPICRLGDGRYKTYAADTGKQITANTEEGLIKKLNKYYRDREKQKNNLTLFFEKEISDRRKNSLNDEKTLTEHARIFNKYVAGDDIAKKNIADIKAAEWIKFFDGLAAGKTKSELNAIKGAISIAYYRAILENVVLGNPITCVNLKKYRNVIKVVDHSLDVYTLIEREKLLNYVLAREKKDAYDYTILLAFDLTIRIGEIKALTVSEVNLQDMYIIVKGQVVKDVYKEHVKGNAQDGKRILALSNRGAEILQHLAEQTTDGGYLLKDKSGKSLDTNTFNSRLKVYCKAVGIRYFPSHKIRFHAASVLFENDTMETREIKDDMGHTNERMTEHYRRIIQKQKPNIKAAEIFNGLNNLNYG